MTPTDTNDQPGDDEVTPTEPETQDGNEDMAQPEDTGMAGGHFSGKEAEHNVPVGQTHTQRDDTADQVPMARSAEERAADAEPTSQ